MPWHTRPIGSCTEEDLAIYPLDVLCEQERTAPLEEKISKPPFAAALSVALQPGQEFAATAVARSLTARHADDIIDEQTSRRSTSHAGSHPTRRRPIDSQNSPSSPPVILRRLDRLLDGFPTRRILCLSRRRQKAKTPMINSSGFLFWRRPTLARPVAVLPSGLQRFTSVFGMGTGGATTLMSPERRSACAARLWWRRFAPRDVGRGGSPNRLGDWGQSPLPEISKELSRSQLRR